MRLLGNTGNPFNNAGPFVGKAIAKILIDPATAGSTKATTLWAATTIGVFSGDTIPTCETPSGPNVGLWRSIDSGETWQLQNVPAGQGGLFSVQDAAIDPIDGNIVYAAVRSTGVFKSVNAKAPVATYANTPAGFPIGSAVTPLRRINVGIGGPSAPGALYAAVENGTGSRVFGLFKTSNGAGNWTHVDDGFNGNATFTLADADPGAGVLTLVLVTRLTGPPFQTNGTWPGRRLLISAPAGTGAVLSRTIFTVVDDSHLFLTTNSTAGLPAGGYSVGNYPTYCDGQCFYDMTIAVDPADPAAQRIYVGGNPSAFSPNDAPNVTEPPCDIFSQPCPTHYNWRSDDGGRRWSSISQGDGVGPSLHTDDHAYAFGADGSLYDGNDGGIWRSANRGVSWTSMNTNIAITQFQGLSLHPTRSIVLGGTQDNGTNIRNPLLMEPPKWFHADFGDGGMSVIDQSSPSRMFHTYFNQAFNFMGPSRSDEGGAGGPGKLAVRRRLFRLWPRGLQRDGPDRPRVVLCAIDAAPRVRAECDLLRIQPRLPLARSQAHHRQDAVMDCGEPGADQASAGSGATEHRESQRLSELDRRAPASGERKGNSVPGASDGRIGVSSTVDGSGVAVWTAIDKPPLPNRAVSQVLPAASDRTGNTVYATFSGFNGATPTTPGHVFRSRNGLGAATWTDISGDLPDVPVNAIAIVLSTVHHLRRHRHRRLSNPRWRQALAAVDRRDAERGGVRAGD